jgi:hypothetical protein
MLLLTSLSCTMHDVQQVALWARRFMHMAVGATALPMAGTVRGVFSRKADAALMHRYH